MRWVLLLGLVAQAHEIGTTRVAATFRDGRYAVEIVTDAAALADKWQGGEEAFLRRVELAFDGVVVRPAMTQATTGAETTIRLTGEIPVGAKSVTWRYGWTFAAYSFQAGAKTVWLEGGQTSEPIEIAAVATRTNRIAVAWQYLVLGFTHILPYGLDHVLFVLGLYLLSTRTRSLLLQVTAFTVAHSITLGLSLYGFVRVAPSVVEPLIAVSIAYVAVENLFLSELKPWRVALVFAFGLLHGLGFAGVLAELGLPPSEFLMALVTFNVGVEAGQLAVIGVAFAAVGWRWSQRSWYRARVVVPASVLIACAAVYWTLERTLG